MKNKKCKLCKGEGWVCEEHADKAWGEGKGCCGGAGMECICTVGGYFGKMKELYKDVYKKIGIPERVDNKELTITPKRVDNHVNNG